MADSYQVETAIVAQILPSVYPAGLNAPSITGTVVRIFRGWPNAIELDADLANGVVNITVTPRDGMSRKTTRYMPEWHDVMAPGASLGELALNGTTITLPDGCCETPMLELGNVPGLTASITSTAGVYPAQVVNQNFVLATAPNCISITLSASPVVGQVVGVEIGNGLIRAAYSYRVVAGDTLTTVAAALAALLPGATSSGAVITVVSSSLTIVAVGTDRPAVMEVRRQTQGYMVTVWTSDPAQRDLVSAAVDTALATMMDANGNLTMFLKLEDVSAGFLTYHATYSSDKAENANLYRRDLCYMVEYPTILRQNFTPMIHGEIIDEVMNLAIIFGFGGFPLNSTIPLSGGRTATVDGSGNLTLVP